MKRSLLFFAVVAAYFLDAYTDDYHKPRAHLAAYDNPVHNTVGQRVQRQFNALLPSPQTNYSPTYSLNNLNTQFYASWSVNDFARSIDDAVYQAQAQGRSRADVEKQLLGHYELYMIPAFQEYIKTFAEYRPHIKKQYSCLMAQKSCLHDIWRKLGLYDQQFIERLDILEKLYAEIVAAEKKEQAIQQQKQQAERTQQRLQCAQAQQHALHAQKHVRHTFENQRAELSHLPDEWAQVQEIYQEHGLSNGSRYERRRQALSVIDKERCAYEFKSYTVSPACAQLMREAGSDITEYQACYGNQLQQVIHQECIDGIDRLASLSETSVVYPYKESLADCFDAARAYNQAGAVAKATAVSDFCWTLLDYGKAIAEGALAGAIGAVEDLLEHPGQAVLCAVAGEYVLAYQLSKIVYNVADIGITYAFDRERGKKEWDEYVAPVTQLIDAISNKELSLRDGLKGATQFAVQWKAQDKLLKGMNKFCKTAKTKAVEFAKNNPLATPEQYMVTPEGIMLQSTQNIQPNQSQSSAYTSFKKRAYKRIAQSGEQCRIVAPTDEMKAWEWAQGEYEKIRMLSDDIDKIATNTNKSKSFIARVKNHVFHDESHILHERVGRLDPDPEIASAWYRLYEGDFITNDINLLEHEYFESKLEKLYKLTLRQAHNATQSTKGKPWYEPKYEEIK